MKNKKLRPSLDELINRAHQAIRKVPEGKPFMRGMAHGHRDMLEAVKQYIEGDDDAIVRVLNIVD